MRRLARLIGITALMAIGFAPAARADSRFSLHVGVGAPAVVAPVARPYGYVWQPGRYVWTGYRYRWIPGRWVRPWRDRFGARDGWRFERDRAPYGDWRGSVDDRYGRRDRGYGDRSRWAR